MKSKVILIFTILTITLSLVLITSVSGADDSLTMAESLLSVGYPNSEYTALRNAYNSTLVDPSVANVDAMETAGLMFLNSLFTPGSEFAFEEDFFEDFSNVDKVKEKFLAAPGNGFNLVSGKYQSSWTTALELFLKAGYDNAKYEFKLKTTSTAYAGFALRVTPAKSTNMYGTTGTGLSFNIKHNAHANSVAIGFYNGAMADFPVVSVPYPVGFNPAVENDFTVYDYGNIISIQINNDNFCVLVFEKNTQETYNKCYVLKADGELAGVVENVHVLKKGGFTVFSRFDLVTLDDFRVSKINGLYEIKDKSQLVIELAKAKAITNDNYVELTWDRLLDAIEFAEEIEAKNDTEVTVAEIDSATGGLITSMEKLTKIVTYDDLTGKIELATASEQFVQILDPSTKSANYMELKHSGEKGVGGILLTFDSLAKGTKTINIHYDCAHNGTLYPEIAIFVYINGSETPVEYKLPSNGNGTWDRYQDFSITVNVVSGANEIRIASAVDSIGLVPRIDYLEFGELVKSQETELPPETEPSPETFDDSSLVLSVILLLAMSTIISLEKYKVLCNAKSRH